MREPRSEQPECWCYFLSDGWQILAGKTALDNDLLSTRFAKANEYWFHIHDQPGSHVILRHSDNSNAVPSQELMEQAASVAAWHSKGRNAPRCTVDCTKAGNVSKPKGAPPGLVTVAHVKRIKVKPQLPNSG